MTQDEEFMTNLTRLIFLLVKAHGGKFVFSAEDIEKVDLNVATLYWEQSAIDNTMTVTTRSMSG